MVNNIDTERVYNKPTAKGATRRKDMGNLALADLNGLWVGFDRLHNEMIRGFRQPEYPRYNLIRSGEEEYTVEVSLAGWGKSDIDVVHSKTDGKLTIKGNKQDKDQEGDSYLHRGISGKSFTKEFHLAEHVVVEEAEFNNGLLTILLRLKLPEDQQPTHINIR